MSNKDNGKHGMKHILLLMDYGVFCVRDNKTGLLKDSKQYTSMHISTIY